MYLQIQEWFSHEEENPTEFTGFSNQLINSKSLFQVLPTPLPLLLSPSKNPTTTGKNKVVRKQNTHSENEPIEVARAPDNRSLRKGERANKQYQLQ
ncbi:MAG: hypothetical protein ABFS38_06680 [Bacteroidota bacterium]